MMMSMMMMVMIKPATLSVLSTQFIPTLCVVSVFVAIQYAVQ